MDGYVRDEALSLSGLLSFEFSVAHGPVTIVHYIWKFRCYPRPLLTVFLASRAAWILRTYIGVWPWARAVRALLCS